jgi:hypothetical protein
MVGGRNLAFILTALLMPLSASGSSWAQSWPTRPVRFILTLGPGSGAESARGCWRIG